MATKVVTFRTGIKTVISDLLGDADMSCSATEEGLVRLVVALADYREEGLSLFPRVLICDDLSAVLRNLQGSDPVKIGIGPREAETLLRALKKCAPLADESWAVYVERRADAFVFGVFREPSRTALDLRQTMEQTENSTPLKALLISQAGPGVVELVRTGGQSLQIHLSGRRDDQVALNDAQSRLVHWCAVDIEDEREQQSFVSFSAGVLRDALRKGHGALIAIAPSGVEDWREEGMDAVLLETPIDLPQLLASHSRLLTSVALADLQANVDLLRGMLNSDGVTVMDSRGRILGFNWFIRTDASSLGPREQNGGARHRAFGALQAVVDEGKLRGVLMRSSDGGEHAYGGAS